MYAGIVYNTCNIEQRTSLASHRCDISSSPSPRGLSPPGGVGKRRERDGERGRILILTDCARTAKTDVTPAILSHECATLSRDKVADAATVELHAATLSRK